MRSLTLLNTIGARSLKSAILGSCVLLFSGGMASVAWASPETAPQHATANAADQNQQLMDQIAELRAQIARLQAAQTGPNRGSTMKPGMPMGATTSPGKGMGMGMPDDQGEMGGMSGGAQGGAPAAAMGMCCMGETGMSGGGRGGMGGGAMKPGGGMAGMSGPSSAMPGQPGGSHLYHIGSTGFFLNHPQHITLTQDQRITLNRLKEKAMLARASTQRRIDQAEQELYMLTGADQPDTSKIQAAVTEIEKLRADERMKFIQAVGEATNVLTHEQHLALMGTMAAGKK